VAVRKALAVHEDAGAIDRFKAPTLEGRGIDQAIAVLNIATDTADGGDGGGGAAAPAAGGAGHATAEEHAADLAKLAAAAPAHPSAIRADDRHPERRMKAAYARFVEEQLVELKAEYPSLRRSQLNDMIYRKWQKSPLNPMNQQHSEYNAKKE
jgi:hypothetical protein